jgi:hypothetical protein
VTVFDKHVESEGEHILGVIFDNEGNLPVADGHWHKEELAGLVYYTTSFPLINDISSEVGPPLSPTKTRLKCPNPFRTTLPLLSLRKQTIS